MHALNTFKQATAYTSVLFCTHAIKHTWNKEGYFLKIYNKSAFVLAALTIFGDRVTLTDALLPFGPNLLSAIREILVFHSILISFLRRKF